MRLFEEFLHDAGASACRRILDAVRAKETLPERVIDEFNSNCFDLTINHEEGSVLLEDVPDVSPEGRERFALDDFVWLLAAAEVRLSTRA